MRKFYRVGDVVRVNRETLKGIRSAPVSAVGVVEKVECDAFDYGVRLSNNKVYYFHIAELSDEEETERPI